ncbi:MAG TPA: G1 family glutamic endopeptidase [Acidimicrobiales bacterium]|nr:G1 family glutamic endopeptidase [Acidimicrobiales bacterium]
MSLAAVHALVAVRPRKHPRAVQIPLASRRRGRAWLKVAAKTAVAGCVLGAIGASLALAPVMASTGASLAAAGPAYTGTASPLSRPRPAPAPGPVSGALGTCSASFNVFSVPPSLLNRCGIVAYPAQRMAALSGGEKTYSYDVAGVEVTYTVPPTTFDPLTASDGLLARYGVPPRPSGSAMLATWEKQMAKLRFVSPPPFLVALSSQATTTTPDYSDHWAGYVAYGGPFKKISSTWVQPSLGPSRCHPNSLTIWAGLGGYESASLAQDGTAENTPAIANNQAWWELTPKSMVPVPLYATVGSAFTADVTYLGGDKFAFFMENDKTGAAWSQSVTSSRRADLTTAESIAERPCLAHCYVEHATYANLSNFGTVVFKSSLVDGKPIGSFTTYQENMDDTGAPFGHELAEPGALSANSTTFTVKQQSCH